MQQTFRSISFLSCKLGAAGLLSSYAVWVGFKLQGFYWILFAEPWFPKPGVYELNFLKVQFSFFYELQCLAHLNNSHNDENKRCIWKCICVFVCVLKETLLKILSER